MSEYPIRFEHVSKSFGDLRVLEDVSFEVAYGTAFVILGRSGTGKSVTLKHLAGILRPDQGKVWIDDQDIASLGREELMRLRRRIGFIFQEAALFDSISVGENVAFPLRRHTEWPERKVKEEADDLLSQVGLKGIYEKMPAELSGGMRKRVALARALAMDPSILLVDEPSGALDPITSDEIDELLLKLKREKETTIVVVTHNLTSARALADEMVVLHEGKIIRRGKPRDLEKSDDPVVQAFFHRNDAATFHRDDAATRWGNP